jgi:hypothetical protein
VVFGVLVTIVVYAALCSAVVPGPLTLCIAACLLCVVPTSPELGRRVALNGAVVIGWAPVLWWVRWPFPLDHGALLVAVATGVLIAMVAFSDRPGVRLVDLLPRVGTADLLLPVALVGGTVALWRWAFPGSPHSALVALLPGADNYAHFSMFATIRSLGATTTALSKLGDGTGWDFDSYPQGFHTLVATVSELSYPHLTSGAPSLVAYTQSVAVVLVLGLLVVTGAVVSLPGLRHRPLIALPVLVVTWAAFLWSPGQDLVADGFANFVLAAMAVACALLLSLAPQRRLAAPDVIAVAGLLVAVAHAWAPLIVLVAPAVLALFHPFRDTWRNPALRRRLGLAAGVLFIAGLGVLKALLHLFVNVDVKTVVTALGGITGTSPLPTFVLLVLALYAFPQASTLVARRTTDLATVGAADRARVLVLVPLAGLAVGSLLFTAQMRTLGTSSYYLLKFLMGFELVLAGVVPALCGMILAAAVSRRRSVARVVLAVGATLLASQSFGLVPHHPVPLLDAQRDGTASVGAPLSVSRMADGILAAADHRGGGAAFERDYLAVGPDRAAEGFYPDAWYHGVTVTLSARVATRLNVLRAPVDRLDAATGLARRLLRQNPDVTLLVDPSYAAAVRAGLGSADLAARVDGW